MGCFPRSSRNRGRNFVGNEDTPYINQGKGNSIHGAQDALDQHMQRNAIKSWCLVFPGKIPRTLQFSWIPEPFSACQVRIGNQLAGRLSATAFVPVALHLQSLLDLCLKLYRTWTLVLAG
eukprot:1138443-Pelagomonas_calceolata.AAC.1